MATFEIPLRNRPSDFTVSLSGTQYTFHTRYNRFYACWVLDIGDVADTPLLQGLPLLPGLDLLAQYQYLEIPGQLWVRSDHGPWDAIPDYASLGRTGHLYYVENS